MFNLNSPSHWVVAEEFLEALQPYAQPRDVDARDRTGVRPVRVEELERKATDRALDRPELRPHDVRLSGFCDEARKVARLALKAEGSLFNASARAGVIASRNSR